MEQHIITSVDVSQDRITVEAAADFTRDYLRGPFWVEYDSGAGLKDLPEGLAVVPFVASVAPVVWLSGMTAHVPALDRCFVEALEDIRAEFVRMYPELEWTGSIVPGEVTTTVDGSVGASSAMLFSGGVDSVYSALALGADHRLVTVQGADIALDNASGWKAVCDQTAAFADSRGHGTAFIRSNLRSFLDAPALERRWPQVGEWWHGVQHGVGLLSLLAPLVPAGVVVISASRSEESAGRPIGSSPELDTSLRWGGTKVVHHGFEASRQDKVEAIVAAGSPEPHLRVCFSDHYALGTNCERCEKCLRTFAGVVVAGGDPTKYGFTRTCTSGSEFIQRRFRSYRLPFAEHTASHWRDIRDHATAERAEVFEPTGEDQARASFVQWLRNLDIDAYARRWRVLYRARSRAIRTVKAFPQAERLARRALYGGRSGSGAEPGR